MMLSIKRYIHNTGKYGRMQIHGRKQANSIVQVRTFINFWTFFDTRRERQFLKVFRIILCKQNSQLPGRIPTSQHHGRNSISTVCLNGRQPNFLSTWPKVNLPTPGPQSTSNWLFFKNLQILGTIASGHDVIHIPATFPIWGLLWQSQLSYPLCVSVNCTQCYAPELRAQTNWMIKYN